MKNLSSLLLTHLAIWGVATTSNAKVIRLPAVHIIEAVQKARQFAEDNKIDLSRHFVLSAEYKNLHNEHEDGYWIVTWTPAAGATEPRIILRVLQDGAVKTSFAEQRPLPRGADVAGFAPDAARNRPEVAITEKDLQEILDTWHPVAPDQWLHRYSHMPLNDRTGTFVVINQKTVVKWLVRAGGLAQLTFPDGSKLHLAKTLPQ